MDANGAAWLAGRGRSYSDSGPAASGQGPPAKRQRLAEAAKLEDQRCAQSLAHDFFLCSMLSLLGKGYVEVVLPAYSAGV